MRCATLSLVLTSESAESALSEEEDGEPPLPIEDPARPVKRLIQAVLLASLQDYVGSQDRQTHCEAERFLFPESSDKKEHLQRLVEASGLDAGWFRDRCEKLAKRTVAPEVQRSANRFNSKIRFKRLAGTMTPPEAGRLQGAPVARDGGR
jgi:hypothetical protein